MLPARMPNPSWLVALLLAAPPAPASPTASRAAAHDTPDAPSTDARPGRTKRENSANPSGENPPQRVVLLGLEGVGWVAPPLASDLVPFDARFVGRSTTPVGMGLLVRYDPNPLVTVELGTRSGSIRYRDRDGGRQVLHDFFAPALSFFVWPLRARQARFGLDAGVGGLYAIARYDVDGARSRQSWGSVTVRAGVDVEVGGPRLSLLFSLHGYGVVTPTETAVSEGPLFEGTRASQRRAPVSRWASWVSGSLGLGYRF